MVGTHFGGSRELLIPQWLHSLSLSFCQTANTWPWQSNKALPADLWSKCSIWGPAYNEASSKFIHKKVTFSRFFAFPSSLMIAAGEAGQTCFFRRKACSVSHHLFTPVHLVISDLITNAGFLNSRSPLHGTRLEQGIPCWEELAAEGAKTFRFELQTSLTVKNIQVTTDSAPFNFSSSSQQAERPGNQLLLIFQPKHFWFTLRWSLGVNCSPSAERRHPGCWPSVWVVGGGDLGCSEQKTSPFGALFPPNFILPGPSSPRHNFIMLFAARRLSKKPIIRGKEMQGRQRQHSKSDLKCPEWASDLANHPCRCTQPH